LSCSRAQHDVFGVDVFVLDSQAQQSHGLIDECLHALEACDPILVILRSIERDHVGDFVERERAAAVMIELSLVVRVAKVVQAILQQAPIKLAIELFCWRQVRVWNLGELVQRQGVGASAGLQRRQT